MKKSNFKKRVMTLLLWRHRYYVTKKRHQTNVTRFLHFEPLPIKISGYTTSD